MMRPHRALAALLTAGFALTAAPTAFADPAAPAEPAAAEPAAATPVAASTPGPAQPATPAEGDAPAAATGAAPVGDAPAGDDGAASPAVTACKGFSAALNYAAQNYEDFAYNTAGNGNSVNYSDPTVVSSNQTGRTALRQAAGTAMDAAGTPGLDPAISSPMRSWSLRATKLVLLMGLHGGGNSLNTTATNMNSDARDVQFACAAAGTHA
ncbi:MAG: hypothetical protein U0R77_01810 [Mycolicibacterium insubricum]|nr:hypothetical protein [Mycobacterium sp.]